MSAYDHEEREEIFSRTLLLLSARSDIENLDAWFLATAENVGKELIRENTRERKILQEVAEFQITLQKQPERSATSLEIRTHTTRNLPLNDSPTWNNLPLDRRKLQWMVKVEGLAVATAAHELGVNRSTAKSWIARDTAKLQKDKVLMKMVGISEHVKPESN